MDTNAIIEFLGQETDLSEVAQITTFKGYRATEAGTQQEVTIEVLDYGDQAGADRYVVSASSDNGRRTGEVEGATVQDAIGTMTVHWGELEQD